MAVASNFEDPARQSQAVFRAVMTAMARPGRIESIEPLAAPSPLPGGMAAIALSLCDFETPVWLDATLREARGMIEWFRFQTGAPLVETPSQAAFAFASCARQCPSLDDFAAGTDENPERSTTCVVGVERLSDVDGVKLIGPGVAGVARLDLGSLRPGFFAEHSMMRTLFPRGIDLVFVCGGQIAALPRTTLIEV